MPATRFVSVKNLGNCVLVNSDTSRFEVDEDKAGRIFYRVVNDTLIIHGDTTLTDDQLARGERNYQLVKIFLPATVQLNANSSNIYIDGTLDSLVAPSYNIHLSKSSELNVREQVKGSGPITYFNRLLINSERSNIEADNKIIVKDLNVTLTYSSRMNSREVTARNMKLDMDDWSTITMSGNSFKALK